MPLAIACLVLLLAGSAVAADVTIDDQPLGAPTVPENPGGARPVLRDCKVTTARSKDAAGAEVETTHRVCHWAVPPS